VTLEVTLSSLPSDKVYGDYTIHGVANRMPERALYLEPEAAKSFVNELAEFMGVSDMLRSPESSLQAVASGRGALPPAYSGHGFGKSIDGLWQRAMKLLGLKTKRDLDLWMEARGWFCFWRDGAPSHEMHGKQTDSETWHYNHFGKGYVIDPRVETTTGYLEAEIKKLYEPAFQAMLSSVEEQQGALAQLRMYGGEIDGDFGPRSKQAVEVFQRAWALPTSGKVDYRTARTLAFVTRKTTIIPVPS
jgi:hypothetical protein